MIVVDASVAAKWLLPEAGTPAALELQEGPDQLFAPDLIRLEVAGSITRRVWAEKEKERLSAVDANARCDRWFQLLERATISLIPESELLKDAVKLSVGIKHSLQDCLYLAAAQQLSAELITADRHFWKRVSPSYKRISMLSGCQNN
jgi:predicted nucleic acid-binding protein